MSFFADRTSVFLIAGVCLAVSTAGRASVFAPGVQVGTNWLDSAAARAIGLEFDETATETGRRLVVVNRGTNAVRIAEFGWRKTVRDDFDAPDLRVYVESWQMASPCGVREWNDEPFDYSLGYLPYCVSTPGDFHPGEKGVFQSDHQLTIRRRDGRMRLYGFTTGARHYGHFRIRLGSEGVAALDILNACQDAELKPGARFTGENLWVREDTDTERLFGAYAERWAADSGARPVRTAPCGWSTWYYYYDKVTLADVLENADWLRAHRHEGFDSVAYIQLDDGFQSALGDWLVPNEKFPGGLPRFVEEMMTRGFKPAVWIGPFMAEENSALFAAHPDWMVKGPDGRPARAFGWREGHAVYALDGTHPAVQTHLRDLFRRLRILGIDYVKLDFCMLASSVEGARYHDSAATGAQALRRGLEAIRAGFGEDGFLLGCTTPFGPAVGLVDAMRAATDITPWWCGDGHDHAEAQTVPNVCRNLINHNYLNGRLWINDPDALIVRDADTRLTESEVRLWARAIRLVGGSLFLSDRLSTLSPARLGLAKEILAAHRPEARAYPVDRWENPYPRQWRTRVGGGQVDWIFDFEKEHGVYGRQPADAPGVVLDESPWWAGAGYWTRRHAAKLAEIAAGPDTYDVVFIGDSITHNWEGWSDPIDVAAVGKVYAEGRLKFPNGPGRAVWDEMKKRWRLLNLGCGGDSTQHVLWRLAHGELDGYRARVVVLMVGTNNGWPAADAARGIRAILDLIAQKQPQAKIILLPLFPKGPTPDDEGRRFTVEVNRLIRPFADGRRIVWCDFTARFLEPDGSLSARMMPDYLHPLEPGYRIWRAAIEPLVAAALSDAARESGTSDDNQVK